MSTNVPNLPKPSVRRQDFFVQLVIDPDQQLISGLRRVTRSLLEHREASSDAIDDVSLIVSELLANAIVHGRGRVTLRLTLVDGDRLFIEVGGENSALAARVLSPPPSAESGRGLALVEALSDVWGIKGDHRTTWATIRLSAGEGRS